MSGHTKLVQPQLRLFIFSAVIILASTASSKVDKGQQLSRAHFEFSLDFYKSLLATETNSSSSKAISQNFVYSPYSLNTVLSMLFLGTSSSSNSSKQLRTMLHFDNISYVDVHNQFKKVVENFDENYYRTKMKVAHGIYVSSEVAVSPPYDRALREFYHSKVEHMDFRNADKDQTLGLINEFVDEVTEGLIPRILEAAPQTEAKLVVVDGMALSARWLFPFDPKRTFDKGLFFLPEDQRIEVSMMAGRFKLPLGYSKELECRVLELPFSQRRISMFLLLPDESVDGLSRLEANISTENIKLLFSTLQDEVVNVRLPKFKLESSIDPSAALKRLGLVDLLQGDTSDLSLMAPTDTLQLSSISHRSILDVSEDGSNESLSKDIQRSSFGQKYFEVDHPFLFLVWDYYSGMLLLMGRVVNPLL